MEEICRSLCRHTSTEFASRDHRVRLKGLNKDIRFPGQDYKTGPWMRSWTAKFFLYGSSANFRAIVYSNSGVWKQYSFFTKLL